MTSAVAPPGSRPFQRLIDFIEIEPRKAFFIFLLFHTVFWTLIPALTYKNLPLDVIEGIAHGRDWHLGYWKHPPLNWWLNDIVRLMTGSHFQAYFLLGQLAVALCFWALWRLGCEFLRPVEALVAVAVLDGSRLFNMMTAEFNHNVLQLPIWALAGWSLYRAFVANRLVDWALVGVWFAVAVYAKYSAATLLIVMLLFAVIDPHARRCWKTPGPYLAILICAVLIVPNGLWLVANNFSPLEFARSKSRFIAEWGEYIRVMGGLALAIIGQIGLVVLLFALLNGRSWRMAPASSPPEQFARRFMLAIAFGPYALTVAAALIGSREVHVNWTLQFWTFFGLLLMTVWRPVIDRQALTRFVLGWMLVTVVTAAVTALQQSYHISGGERWATQFPGRAFAAAVADRWRSETNAPLTYVVGDFWLAGNVILNVPNPPHLLQDGDSYYNPAIDVNDVRRRGAMLLWINPPLEEMPKLFRQRFPDARLNPPLLIRTDTPRGEWVWRIGWAILPPSGN